MALKRLAQLQAFRSSVRFRVNQERSPQTNLITPTNTI
jgi:hypothetical protein